MTERKVNFDVNGFFGSVKNSLETNHDTYILHNLCNSLRDWEPWHAGSKKNPKLWLIWVSGPECRSAYLLNHSHVPSAAWESSQMTKFATSQPDSRIRVIQTRMTPASAELCNGIRFSYWRLAPLGKWPETSAIADSFCSRAETSMLVLVWWCGHGIGK